MQLIAGKVIIGGICHAIRRYAKAYKKCVKVWGKYPKYWNVNNYMIG